MIITLSPVRRDGTLTLSRAGPVLVLNGSPLDLEAYIADPLSPHDWICGQPGYRDGRWHVTLILPHGPDATAETLFPAPLEPSGDGPVALPPP